MVGRFAPSPTGRMHAGNIYAALMAWLVAKSANGRVVLRIEDLDAERSRAEFADLIQRDLESLGLTWDEGPHFQHDRAEAYQAAFKELASKAPVFPCFCTRADLHAASAPHRGEKLVYPGTCWGLNATEVAQRSRLKRPSLRVHVPDTTIAVVDAVQGEYRQRLAKDCGDFVVRRADGAFAYQLAVVVDDAAQGVNSVVRGVDLLCSTPQQVFLQETLGCETPQYAHVPLLVAQAGRRLSKRDKDASLDEMLARYRSPQGVLGHIAYVVGLAAEDAPATPGDLLEGFSIEEFKQRMADPIQIQWRAD